MGKRKGIVGHAADKFNLITERTAKNIFTYILESGDIVVSGKCHLGGIDIWAEEYADSREEMEKDIYAPAKLQWEGGYRDRNLLIAKRSDIIHVIVVKEYPENYKGRKFHFCYHCNTTNHIKSGACWTAWKAIFYGKPAVWHIIDPAGLVEVHVEFPKDF